MMAFIKEHTLDSTKSFSLLYRGNVIGATCGTVLSAGIFIKLWGFHRTLWIAGGVNLIIAVIAFIIAAEYKPKSVPAAGDQKIAFATLPETDHHPAWILTFVLFITGFISMAMEVVWIRAFTPVLQTTIYAFAALLAMYLTATWLGTSYYRIHLTAKRVIPLEWLVAAMALTALVPPILNDPRITHLQWLKVFMTLVGLVPFCTILGYVTPKIIDEFSCGDPNAAGRAYAINVLGCILGPLVAGYMILPFLGVRYALILLALPCLAAFSFIGANRIVRVGRLSCSVVFVMLACFIGIQSKCYEDGLFYRSAQIRRDRVATVIAHGEGMDKGLPSERCWHDIPDAYTESHGSCATRHPSQSSEHRTSDLFRNGCHIPLNEFMGYKHHSGRACAQCARFVSVFLYRCRCYPG